MNRQACSICSTVTGFWPITRLALSPRPMPTSIRPPETSWRVAIALAVTVMSRVAGLVTQGPSRTRSVLAATSANVV